MLGDGIRTVRKKKKVTQTDLAEMAGQFRSHISQLEGGMRHPSINALKNYAEFLEVHPALFFWFGINRDEIDQDKRAKFDILKPSIDELIDEIFFGKD